MNRQELSWALSAVLPHAGKRHVGFEQRDGRLYIYGTDAYTLGIASLARDDQTTSCLLSTKEATELERWVRPNRVAEHAQDVLLVVDGDELHVGLSADDSAVFACDNERGSYFDNLLDVVNMHNAKPTEFRPVPINPKFLARFEKAGSPITLDFKAGKSAGSLIVRAACFVGAAMDVAYEFAPATNLTLPTESAA